MSRSVSAPGLARFSIAALLFTAGPVVGATNVYKCVDVDGGTYFSDKQCTGLQKQTSIELKPNPAASGGDLANLKEREARQRRMLNAGAEDRRDRRRERDEERARKKAEKAAICAAEKERLGKLQSRVCTREEGCTFYGLTKLDEDGNSVIASEQEKKAEVNRLKQSIAKNCG